MNEIIEKIIETLTEDEYNLLIDFLIDNEHQAGSLLSKMLTEFKFNC